MEGAARATGQLVPDEMFGYIGMTNPTIRTARGTPR